MSVGKQVLKVSEEITNSSYVADTYTPANGEKVYVRFVSGAAPSSVNSVVEAIWDPDGTPDIFWLTKGAQSEGAETLDEVFTGNGTKKISIKCTNGETGNMKMYGKLILRTVT